MLLLSNLILNSFRNYLKICFVIKLYRNFINKLSHNLYLLGSTVLCLLVNWNSAQKKQIFYNISENFQKYSKILLIDIKNLHSLILVI